MAGPEVYKKGAWVSPAETLPQGASLFCFTCDKGTMKSQLRQKHLGHDVAWVKDKVRVDA